MTHRNQAKDEPLDFSTFCINHIPIEEYKWDNALTQWACGYEVTTGGIFGQKRTDNTKRMHMQ
jgi:hypothetical protein